MFVRLCLNLACLGMLCSAARIRRRLQSNWPNLPYGTYVISVGPVNVQPTVYSNIVLGKLTNGQRVQVVETIETRSNHIVYGRIESPFAGYFPLLDKERGTQHATFVEEAHSVPQCELREQPASFCELSADAMKWSVVGDKLKDDKPVGVARLKFVKKESKSTCFLQYAFGYATEAEAQRKAMECCEKSREEQGNDENPTKECKLVGPSVNDGFEANCNFRLGKKWFMKSKCYCPKERPHTLKPGSSITWHVPGQPELLIGVEEQVICVDECTARSLTASHMEPKTDLKVEKWPVVFLAVYTLGFGIVHSNLAFCPDKSIVKGRHACLQPGASKSSCSTSHHTSEFASSNDVPRLLMDHGCRELIFDGNHGGGLWTPHERETGCWAQGWDSQEFWWEGGHDGTYRTGLGYQKLFWLTSDNAVRPFADPPSWFESGQLGQSLTSRGLSESSRQSVEMRMKKCFGDKLGNRIDFNPGTYSLLHHNCNKFSSETMRELNLPKFYDAADKGTHGSISLSATTEESALRRGLHKAISYFAGHERSTVSATCQAEFFHEGKLNCRRIGWGGRKGDCPTDIYDHDALRCYDPNLRSSEGTSGLSETVAYDGHVKGVCGLPAGSPCKQHGDFSRAPCQPGFRCAATDKESVDANKTGAKVRSFCVPVEDCSNAVSGAIMRESDNPVTGAWCKCPKGTKVHCGSRVLERYFNPAAMQGGCSCKPDK